MVRTKIGTVDQCGNRRSSQYIGGVMKLALVKRPFDQKHGSVAIVVVKESRFGDRRRILCRGGRQWAEEKKRRPRGGLHENAGLYV